MCPHFVIISDDLSGGMNIGVEFATAGLRSVLASYLQLLTGNADVLIVNTETRNKLSSEAYLAAQKAAEATRSFSPEIVVKKIDSLLRGSIWPEIDAVREVYGFDRCLLLAASPKINRTTIHATHYVDGELLEAARQRVDPSSSVTESLLPSVLDAPSAALLDIDVIRQGANAIQAWFQKTEDFLCVADCTSQDELNAVVTAAYAEGIRFFAGTYGLGEALCRIKRETDQPVLVVVGSLSLATHQQVDYLAQRPDCAHICIRYDSSFFDRPVAEQAQQYRSAMELSSNHVSCVIFQMSVLPEAARQLWHQAAAYGLDATAVSERIDAVMKATLEPFLPQYGGFVATGGSTANSLFQLFQADSLSLEGLEVLPGTPGARIVGGGYDGLPFIAKPGSQGNDDALARLVDYVRLMATRAQ